MNRRAWLGPLGRRDYRLFFTGYTTSWIGTQMAPVAVTFAVLHRHGTASDVGYVLAAQAIPLVTLILAGGVVAHRLGARTTLVVADLVRAAAHLTLATWLLTGSPPLWGFVVAEVFVGAGDALFGPSMTTLMPQLAGGPQLQQANTLNGLVMAVGSVVGPAVAGVVVAAGSPGAALTLDGVSYLVSAWCLARLTVPAAEVTAGSFLTQLREGWREFRARTWLWVVVAQFALWHLVFFAPFMVLGAVVSKESLGGAGAWGAILAAMGVGSVAAGLVLLRWRPARPLVAGEVGVLLGALPVAALALHASTPVIAVCAAGAGAGLAVFGPLWETTMQEQVPAGVLSRVSAYDWFGSVAFLPLGYLVVGPVSGLLGMSATLWLAAAFVVVSTAVVLLVPDVTGMRRAGTGQPSPKDLVGAPAG